MLKSVISLVKKRCELFLKATKMIIIIINLYTPNHQCVNEINSVLSIFRIYLHKFLLKNETEMKQQWMKVNHYKHTDNVLLVVECLVWM